MEGDSALHKGSVTCASWIRRPDKAHLVVLGRSRRGESSPSVLEIFSFDAKTFSLSSSPKATYVLEDGDPVSIAVHPSGDDIICSTTTAGCRVFELCVQEESIKLLAKDLAPLQGVGPQKCLAFSTDGSKFASGGEDGCLKIFEWPSLGIILDEPKAHKSFRDLDISLDSEFLASTSIDGSARIWSTSDGLPLASLTRNSDEKIECCRFSRDGTKPFLFCTVQKGDKAVVAVWDISTWNRIGHKKLPRKSISVLSISLDGKYLAMGSKEGDIYVINVKKMELCHWSKRLHLGTYISLVEFCPSERVVLSTSSQWGAVVTKLNVPADWKEWQLYLVLLGLFMASAVLFYIFFQNSDSFWNFPLGRDQPARPKVAFFRDPETSDDPNSWGPLDL
ncbi:SEC12-like protein 1 [Macadamia integrifolia]|uniref:SEC12-like protein 1 n=1 Tax=Macadamia integrifolia TaxID=60698 RepID=UPI001C4E4315|nr:SEC12-like protein 1 [Macadamia integrifolia]